MKKIFSIACIICITSIALLGNAKPKPVKMIFWYPGEAGSTEEAQSFLDLFFEWANSKIAPDKIEGKYFNTVKGGLDYIRNQKPTIAIISNAAWIQNRDKIGNATVILGTLPLPSGRDVETYTLVGIKSSKIEANTQVLSSEPLSKEYVVENLFPKLKSVNGISQDAQILHCIKKIADGSLNAVAILTPMETSTLKRMNAPWAKNLKTIYESKPVLSARVVAFNESWNGLSKFKNSLLIMNIDQKGGEILNELRLKGFCPGR